MNCDVSLIIRIPLRIENVESDSIMDAANKATSLLRDTLPVVMNHNYEKIKEQMIIELKDIEQR